MSYRFGYRWDVGAWRQMLTLGKQTGRRGLGTEPGGRRKDLNLP